MHQAGLLGTVERGLCGLRALHGFGVQSYSPGGREGRERAEEAQRRLGSFGGIWGAAHSLLLGAERDWPGFPKGDKGVDQNSGFSWPGTVSSGDTEAHTEPTAGPRGQ